jgi:D-beta-D-heptose 7-phosphate kinase/D-beta-D-heptose 1-phosphate adenosyltransferase
MILVVGDAILDVDRRFTTTRMCPEKDDAPVLTPLHSEAEMRLGGALNVWHAIRELGTECSIISVLGNDQPGEIIRAMVGDTRRCLLAAKDDNPTTVKERVYIDGVLRYRMDNDRRTESLSTYLMLERHVLQEMALGHVDLLVLSDYGKGALAHPENMIAAAKRDGIPVLVDPKGSNWDRYRRATVLKPNFKEYSEWDAESCDNSTFITTMGANGMIVDEFGTAEEVYGIPRTAVDVTGAGDMACAALAVCMAKGLPVLTAAQVANVLAGWSVEFQGVKTFTKQEATDECARFGTAFPN